MKSRLLLNVIIRESSAIFELLSGKDKTLLLWRNSFLILDLRLDVRDRVVRLDIQGDRLSREGLDEDLHGTTTETEDKMEGGFLLNIVIREGSTIFELFSSEDQTLLLWWDSFLVLDLSLDIGDRVVGLDIQGDRLSRKGLDENLHGTTTETEDKMEGGFLLNVVIREGSAIFELFSSKDQSLLLWWNAFLILDLRLDVGDRVVWLDIQGNSLSREGLDEDLHGTTSKSKDKMKGGLFLDVVIRESSTIFELLSSEDQSLLLWWNSFLVLNLRLDIRDGVIRLDVQGDRLSREGLDENLHGTTTETKDKMKSRLFLNVVIRKCSAIFELFSGEDQSLLLRWNSFLVLDLGLDVRDGVIWLDVQGDRLSREGLDENLHGTTTETKDKMKSRLFLNVVIREGSAIFELFSGEDQSLLLWRDSFLVLNLRLDVRDRVIWLDVQGDRLPREGLDENLHGTTT